MSFLFQKISNQGSSHPINARIFIGLSDILKNVRTSKEDKEVIKELLFELSEDLLKAESYALEVMREYEAVELKLASISNETLKEVPSLLLLSKVQVFLKYSKSTFSKINKIIGVLTKNNFDGLHFHKIEEKIQRELFDDYIVSLEILKAYKPWYEKVMELRNEDEHPKRSGSFLVNYTVVVRSTFFGLNGPVFYDGTPVYGFLEASVKYILPFCEELILSLMVKHLPEMPMLDVVEIPELKRNMECPKRFKVVPRGMD